MTTNNIILRELQAFGEAYDYDVSYIQGLYEASPGAHAVFAAAQPMSAFREKLPLEAHFVARVVTMQAVDCGPCAQLNLKMAIEAGLSRDLLRTLLKKPDQLPAPLRDIREHVQAVLLGSATDTERCDRIREQYGDAAFAELAVCIVGSQIFPTLKRALSANTTCQPLTLDFDA